MSDFLRKLQESIDPTTPLGKALVGLDHDAQMTFFFRNDGSNSMTRRGYMLLKTMFETWEVALEKPLSSNQLLLLSRHSKLPYYVGEKILAVFERDIGTWLMLGNDPSAIERLFER